MKNYIGSVVRRSNFFHWRYRDVNGKSTSKVIKNANGVKVTDLAEAEAVAAQWSEELFALHQLKTKEQVIQQIAETRDLLHLCKEPIERIEQAFFDHPSAPEISPHHRGNYHSTLNRLIAFTSGYGVKTVADVTEHIAQDFLTYNWKRGISAKTYNSNLDVLKRVFRLLCKEQNPFAEFKKKPGCAEMRQAFTTEQLQKIWETLQSPDYHILYKEEMMVLYKLALYTGARCGDLCLLKWRAVDLEHRLIRFMPHKTATTSRKRVEIPMSDVLFEALKTITQESEYVLPQVAERYKHNPGGISRDTKKLIEAAGFQAVDEGETRRLRNVSRLGFHAFRHSYVSMLINSGVNPLVVRDLVGHTTVDMTARYTHVALDTKINAVKSLPIFTQSESPVQTNPLSAIITDLQTKDLIRLGTFLENILTEEQKRELIQKLQ